MDVGDKQFLRGTKFAQIVFHLSENDRFSWQISRYKLLKGALNLNFRPFSFELKKN